MGRRNQLAAPQTAFNPAQLRGLELWLDAADTTTLFQDTAATTPATAVTNPVGYWRDKSGFNRHATQGTAANRPAVATHSASGKTVLSFDGSNDFLSSGTTDSWRFLHNGTPHNIFVVYSVTTGSTCGVLATGTTGTSTGFDLLAHTTFMRHGVINASSGPNVLDNSVTLLASNSGMRTLRVRGFAASTPAADRSTLFADGVTQYKNNTTTGTVSTSASTHPLIIGARGGPNAPLAGTIAEVLVFNSMASETDLQQVEQYLLRKWAVPLTTAVASPLDIPNCAIWLDGADTSTMYTSDAGAVTPVTAPTDIAGCVGWWDASDASSITQSGGLISQWNDKSGNGRHATASGTTRPTYTGTRNGKNVVTFDGTGNRMNTTLVDSATQTILFVAKATAAIAPGTRRVVSYQAERGFFASSGWNWFSPNAGTGVSPTDYNVAGGVITNDTSMLVYGNGVAVSAAFDPFNAGATTFVIGGENASTASNLFQGEIAEVVVFNSALSTANRARVERYLSLKWGVPGVHSQVTSPGQPVGYWADKSGNDRHFTQAVGSRQPRLAASAMNGKPLVQFDGADDFLTGNAAANGVLRNTSAFTIVSTFISTLATSSRTLFYSSSGTNAGQTRGGVSWLSGRLDLPTMRLDNNLTVTLNGAGNVITSSVPHTVTATVDFAATTGRLFRNSIQNAASTAFSTSGSTSDTAAILTSVGAYTGPAFVFQGFIAELIVYRAALTDQQRAQLEQYLNNKWGVGLIPPVASHPDAQRWVQQVYFNGGTCSQNTVDAVSSFCREIDAAGLRSKFYRLNLFCGNELLACRTPLYRGPNANERHGFDLDVLTNGSGGSVAGAFTNTDYTEYGISGGLAGRLQTTTNSNAGTGLRTGIVPAFIPAFYGPPRAAGPSYNYSSIHLAAYIRKLRNQTLSTGVLLGAYGGLGANFSVAGHGMTFSVNQSSWYVGPFQASIGGGYDNVDRGLYLANVQSTSELVSNEYVSELTLYGGAMRYATGRSTLGPFLHPNTDFGIFGELRTSIAYSPSDNSLFRAEQTMQGYSIGLGMTEAEAQAYSQIMNRFQNRLGRGLPENTMPAFATISNLDTQDWLTRVYAAGGNVSTSTAEAVQTFCNAITTAGIRDRFFRLNLFCGNNLEACVVPLYRGPTRTGTQYGGLTDRNLNFLSTDYVERGLTGGLLGDGTTKHLDTALSVSSLPATNTRHLAFYLTSPATSGDGFMGARATDSFYVEARNPPIVYFRGDAAANAAATTANVPFVNKLVLAENSVNGANTNARVFFNATLSGQRDNVTAGGAIDRSIYVFAINNSGTTTNRSGARCAMYSVGRDFGSDAARLAFNNAVQTFQAALLRDRASADPVFASITNTDAQLWLDNVYANGGTVSLSTATAVQTFCNAINAAGIRDKFYRLNLFCGNNFAAALVPLYRGQSSGGTQFGNATDIPNSFTAAQYAETGATGGLSTDGGRYLDIGTITSMDAASQHVSNYVRLRSGQTAVGGFGINIAGTGWETRIQHRGTLTGRVWIGAQFWGGDYTPTATVTQTTFVLGSRTSASNMFTQFNGVANGGDTTSRSVPAASAASVSVCSQGAGSYFDGIMAGYSFGLGMTTTQAQAFNTAMQAFQTALSRNV